MNWNHELMTRKLNITPEAEQDIFAIASNIHLQDSLASARHAVSEIKKHLNNLADHLDSARAGVCDGTSEAVISGFPYVAVYKESDNFITIVRILYGAEERRLKKR